MYKNKNNRASFSSIKFGACAFVPYLTNGLSNLYHLDESFILGASGVTFHFFDENHVSKQSMSHKKGRQAYMG